MRKQRVVARRPQQKDNLHSSSGAHLPSLRLPQETLRAVPVPTTAGIPFFPVRSFRSDPASGRLAPLAPELTDPALAAVLGADMEAASSPFALQLDHLESSFLRLEVALDTSVLAPAQRLFLTLLDEVAFKLPTRDPAAGPGAAERGHEETVAALERELVGYGCAVGFGGSNFAPGAFGQFWRVHVKVRVSRRGGGVLGRRRR